MEVVQALELTGLQPHYLDRIRKMNLVKVKVKNFMRTYKKIYKALLNPLLKKI